MRTVMMAVAAGCLMLSAAMVTAEEIPVDSQVTAVTVFPDSALVTRTATMKLGQGRHQVIVRGIVPEIDQNSLRVSAGSADGVRLLGARVETEYLENTPAERVKELTEKLQQLLDTSALLKARAQVLADEKSFLDSIRLFSTGQIPKDLVTRMPLAKDLEESLKFLDDKLQAHAAGVIDNAIKQRELAKTIDAVQRELSQVAGPDTKARHAIVVDVQAGKTVSAELAVTYLVRGALWSSLYDARADFESSQVELVLNGVVRQQTGEDWTDVTMTLSTAKPAIGGMLPPVESWVVRPYQPMPRAPKMALATMKQAFDRGMADSVAGSALEENFAPATTVQEKGIAVVYTLAQKVSCKSDGTENKFPVVSQKLKAGFDYSAYPRAVMLAYLGSRVKNAPDLQLPGGPMNIYLAGDYVGSSAIENIGPGEEFDLYLGADENVKVKRELIEKKVDETLIGGIPSPNKTTVFKYKLTVENYKTKPVHIKLYENIPVSQDDRIKLKNLRTSIEPDTKDWKDKKGVWLWKLKLDPKQKTEIVYSYTIEHPRDMHVDGL